MATNKGNRQAKPDTKTTAAGKAKVEWKGYINYSPNKADKDRLAEFSKSPDKMLELWSQLAEDGYAIKQTYDEKHAVFVCGLFNQDPTNQNAGWYLSQRAPDPYQALIRVMYVHFIVYEEFWGGDHETTYKDPWA